MQPVTARGVADEPMAVVVHLRGEIEYVDEIIFEEDPRVVQDPVRTRWSEVHAERPSRNAVRFRAQLPGPAKHHLMRRISLSACRHDQQHGHEARLPYAVDTAARPDIIWLPRIEVY